MTAYDLILHALAGAGLLFLGEAAWRRYRPSPAPAAPVEAPKPPEPAPAPPEAAPAPFDNRLAEDVGHDPRFTEAVFLIIRTWIGTQGAVSPIRLSNVRHAGDVVGDFEITVTCTPSRPRGPA